MEIVQTKLQHQHTWVAVRKRLWPGDPENHKQETAAIVAADSENAFLLIDGQGKAHGFIEGKYYHAKGQKYGHVEGWFVEPQLRGQGFGAQLLEALEHWFLHHSITCFHSDTIEEEYPLSKRAHIQNGYEPIYQITVLLKKAGRK